MMREPKTDPIPAPEPATPTVAAPAPMNLAAESMSLRATEVDRAAVCWLTGAAAGWTHMADEAGLQARAFLEQLLIGTRRADSRNYCHKAKAIRRGSPAGPS